MNVFEVKLTRQAEQQMQEIASYIAVELHNPDAAENIMDAFGELFVGLCKNPEKHPIVDDEPWKSEEVRWTRVKNYLIYFWIDMENAAVQVTGIVYAARDQKKFMEQMKMTD